MIVAINKITDESQYFFKNLIIINPRPMGIESKLQHKNIKYIVVNSLTGLVKDDVKDSPNNLMKTSS
ncbi:hypothetical protein NIES25_27710 [Nostoc linckia NIES-25]|nr:hypothetical protein NIES25_27710 [Nostoc linckia NIES-25]